MELKNRTNQSIEAQLIGFTYKQDVNGVWVISGEGIAEHDKVDLPDISLNVQSRAANWDEYNNWSTQYANFVDALEIEFCSKIIAELNPGSGRCTEKLARYAETVVCFQPSYELCLNLAARSLSNVVIVNGEIEAFKADVAVNSEPRSCVVPDVACFVGVRTNDQCIASLSGRPGINKTSFTPETGSLELKRELFPYPNLLHSRLIFEKPNELDVKALLQKNSKHASSEPFLSVLSEEVFASELAEKGLLEEFLPEAVSVYGHSESESQVQCWIFSPNRAADKSHFSHVSKNSFSKNRVRVESTQFSATGLEKEVFVPDCLFSSFLKAVNAPYWSVSDVAKALRSWADAVGSGLEEVPHNFSRLHGFFNQDWKEPNGSEREYILFRGVLSSFFTPTSLAVSSEDKLNAVHLTQGVLSELGLELTEEQVSDYLTREAEFQSFLSGVSLDVLRAGLLNYEVPCRFSSLYQIAAGKSDYLDRVKKLEVENYQLKNLVEQSGPSIASEAEFYKAAMPEMLENRFEKLRTSFQLAESLARFIKCRPEVEIIAEAQKKLGFYDKEVEFGLYSLVDFSFVLSQNTELTSDPAALFFDTSLFHISPNPCFDSYFFAENQSRPLSSYVVHPFLHFLLLETRLTASPHLLVPLNGLAPEFLDNSHELFDEAFYSETYKPKEHPLSHFIKYGSSGLFDPNPKFSSRRYLTKYADIFAAGYNPLVHWITSGKKEGREF